MRLSKLAQAVQPFIAAVALVATASVLVFAIYFTWLDLAWIAFLSGVLFAGFIAVVSRATRAEYALIDGAAKLAVAESKLSQQVERSDKLDAMLAAANMELHYADGMLPVMIAYVDAEGIYRYHNSAFRRWLDLPSARIDGHPMRDALGPVVYAGIEPAVLRVLAGEPVRYVRSQKMASGAIVRVHVQLLPVLAAGGKLDGFYAVITDITSMHAGAAIGPAATGSSPALPPTPAQIAIGAQAQFNSSIAQVVTGMPDARERILSAIERNEFVLYCQHIVPIEASAQGPRHHEILIRLREEEEKLIPPGAFFPLVEEAGLLQQLDRWVITNLLQWVARHHGSSGNHERDIFFINIAAETLRDVDFPDHVAHQLHKRTCPGSILCFEIAESDVVAHRGDVDAFVRAVRSTGCKIALSGFGRNRASIQVLKELPVDFLKIDGSIVLQATRDPVSMGKLVAINRLATSIGIATVAEMVEDDATIASLRKIKVLYGQGFGLSRPQPLSGPD